MRLMARGEWYGRSSLYRLAEEWGLNWQTIKKHSATASAMLQVPQEELAEQRLVHAQVAERICREALETVNKRTGLPDFAAALDANLQAAQFRGIEASPQQAGINVGQVLVQVTPSVARAFAPPVEAKPPELPAVLSETVSAAGPTH